MSKKEALERKIENQLIIFDNLSEILRKEELKKLYHSMVTFEHDVTRYILKYTHHHNSKTDEYINRLKKIMGE